MRGSGYGLTHYGRALAQAIEARRAATLGAVHESAVAESDAPNPCSTPTTGGDER
jgi:hypothetical protein